MNFETGKTNVPLWLLLVLGLIIAIVAFGLWYYKLDAADAKLIGLIGGIETGLIVYLLTFVTLLRPLQELDRFRRIGVKALLANRHDQDYYRKLVGKSTRRVDVMGASCSRFVQDFLDLDSEDKVLVDAMNAHNYLKVRLLIPDESYMSDDARRSLPRTEAKVAALRKAYGDRIELRKFQDKARHSFVLVDNDVIAGPIFGDDKSKYGPAVHAAAETVFGRKYEEYFDLTWSLCPSDA